MVQCRYVEIAQKIRIKKEKVCNMLILEGQI